MVFAYVLELKNRGVKLGHNFDSMFLKFFGYFDNYFLYFIFKLKKYAEKFNVFF